MKLDRPIVFLDLETTHLDVSLARIVEIALVKLKPDATTESFLTRVNPQISIPADATEIHGINNFDVMDKPTFKELALDIYAYIQDCDLAGYNLIAYDLPILQNEFKRAGVEYATDKVSIIDVMKIFKRKEKRDLTAAYRFYCQKELEGAHGALKDTQATLDILLAQLQRYHDLPQDVAGLHKFCNARDSRYVDNDKKFIWTDNEACFTFGKYKGQSLRKVVKTDRDYLSWILQQNFSAEVIGIIRSALNGNFPVKTETNNSDE